jgi:N-acetylmuramoyl-L-alanine amidase
MGKLTILVIHCTASKKGKELTAADIRREHCSPPPAGRGWHQVGYADIIHQDGRLENLVPYDGDDIIQPREITNGVEGFNSEARHVAYIGGLNEHMKPEDTRTSEQANALKNYVYDFLHVHPRAKVGGHRQFNKNKECPCFDVPSWLMSIGINKSNIY